MSESNGTHDIANLIGETEDRATRGVLVVLHKITKGLADNSRHADDIRSRMDRNQEVFNAHIEKFQTHAENEAKMFQRIVGSWKVVAVILPSLASLVVIGGGYILAKQISVNESQGLSIAQLQSQVAELRANMDRNTKMLDAATGIKK